jgi:tyrosinase
MPPVPRTPQRETIGRIRYRKSVERLTARQLSHLRHAFGAVMPISDERGYQYHAGIHGVPLPSYCQHGQPDRGAPLFLPWHRAYLYFFELALQDQRAGVSVPWWDWTSPTSHRDGIPPAFADRRAGRQPNPLFSAEIQPNLARRDRRWPRRTSRDPDAAAQLPTPQRVNEILALGDFYDFSTQLEDVHGQIHGWMGGTMGLVAFAAYDPIFWSHHAMVDRIWRLWQLRHPGIGPSAGDLDRALPPFEMTVRETLSVARLGYDYAVSTTHVDTRVR